MRTDPLYQMALQQGVLSLVVHADSKVGKSTLAGTCPKPMLIIDAEGGSKFLPYAKTFWDPMTPPPPECDGTWEMCVVTVRDYSILQMTYNWLVTGQHCFASLAIDSITEVQRRIKDSIGDFGTGSQNKWGDLLTKMERLVRDYRDLTLHPTNPLSVAVFIAETRQNGDGRWRPYLQGAMATSLPYLVDVVGYLFVAKFPDPVDPLVTLEQRQMLVDAGDPRFEAGERVQGRLGGVVGEPRIDVMLSMVYPHFYQ